MTFYTFYSTDPRYGETETLRERRIPSPSRDDRQTREGGYGRRAGAPPARLRLRPYALTRVAYVLFTLYCTIRDGVLEKSPYRNPVTGFELNF